MFEELAFAKQTGLWARSSVRQSTWLLTRWSRVQIPSSPLFFPFTEAIDGLYGGWVYKEAGKLGQEVKK